MTRSVRNTHRDASAILRKSSSDILDSWSECVRNQIPRSGEHNTAILRDGIRQFVESLADVISTTTATDGGERFAEENREGCRRHGAELARNPQYTLIDIIQEYKVLRQVIFELLDRECQISTSEREKLLDAIDNGISEAATEFAALRGFPESRIGRAEAERNVAVADATESRLDAQRSRSVVERMELERELRESFVSALSHDLRTPLTAARMCAQLILMRAEDPNSSRKMAARIIDTIDRTDRMIQDLLDANRIRAGERLPLSLEELDLAELTRATLFDLSTIHGDRFILDSDPKITGRWSRKELRRVIENLVNNAVKYGDPRAPVAIKLFGRADKAVLSIHNDGNPIPSEIQKKLFKNHHRAPSALKDGHMGWGLGLTLVLGITEAHGGTIRVESRPGFGTTFIVELPRQPQGAY